MSIYLAESFDGVATSAQLDGNQTIGSRWGNFNNTWVTSSVFARTGNNLLMSDSTATPGISLGSTTFNDYLAQDKEIYAGCAFRTPSLGSGSRGVIGICAANGGQMNAVTMNTNGSLNAERATSAIASSLPGILTVDTWYYIEFYLKRSDSGGRFVVRVNDLIVIDFTGDTFSNTQATSNNPYLTLGNQNPLSPSNRPAVTSSRYDDLYIVSVDGVGHNGFCGTSYVPCLRPNANGSSSQWVGSDGNSTDNYLLVDEQSINDADFVEATNNGERDLYNHESYDVPAGQTILSVQLNARCAYLSTARDLGFVAKESGGTTEVKESVMSNGLHWRWKNFETKPSGGPWPEDTFNDAEFGFEQAAV